ncbi:hypothetical protein GIB67_042814 [Kingdonia uniflora]|uniref:Anthocyanin acyltransferase n=1 Tax=Kingdonia uniflora TaxID=39325 RepID=A0A7J7NSX2_9MAGN|nr:hypothetical protein GIB67_042814 [Kingdonia uniflora]
MFKDSFHAFYHSTHETFTLTLLAVRVTLFPNSGICMGTTTSHAAVDGMAIGHFLRSWASFCSHLGGDTSLPHDYLLPTFDRSTITDPYGIKVSYLKDLKRFNISQQSFSVPSTPTDQNDKVVATFVMDLVKIEKLKKWVSRGILEKNKKDPTFNLTTLVVTCAHVWVCLVQALGGDDTLETAKEHFIVAVDCRTRLDPALPQHIFIAKLLVFAQERLLGVSGSPRLKLYDVNFGWGKSKKVEIISSTVTYGCVTLSESESGKVEVPSDELLGLENRARRAARGNTVELDSMVKMELYKVLRFLKGIFLGVEEQKAELKKRVMQLEKDLAKERVDLAEEKECLSSDVTNLRNSFHVAMDKLGAKAKNNVEEVNQDYRNEDTGWHWMHTTGFHFSYSFLT